MGPFPVKDPGAAGTSPAPCGENGTYPPSGAHILGATNDRGVAAMQTEWNENRIVLHGRVCQDPAPSHTNHGEAYMKFPLAVRRLSGAEDRVNVVVSAALLERCPLAEGVALTVEGEVRSFNNKSGVGSRLVISVYARQLRREAGEEENRLHLTGTLCKGPVYRRTPLGRDICDLMLAVNRRYGRTDYLPCITWGALARRCAGLSMGERVELEGRLQSRTYTKRLGEVSEERTAFEISVSALERLTVPAAESRHSMPEAQGV